MGTKLKQRWWVCVPHMKAYLDLDVNLAHRMLYAGWRCSSVHLREDWEGFSATLDILKYRKISYPSGIEPRRRGRPAHSHYNNNIQVPKLEAMCIKLRWLNSKCVYGVVSEIITMFWPCKTNGWMQEYQKGHSNYNLPEADLSDYTQDGSARYWKMSLREESKWDTGKRLEGKIKTVLTFCASTFINWKWCQKQTL